jgi:RNA polymerase sigma-70 factor, ECF subfamily
MPPYDLWLQGPDQVRAWLLGRGSVCRGSRLVPTAACGAPAFGHYHRSQDVSHDSSGFTPWGVIILEMDDDRISGWNSFLDTETLFPIFGLPQKLSA